MNFRKVKKNFRRDMRAISPVIATLLMIAIAVVASLVAYAWVMGYMGFTTSKTGKAIQIQSVSFDSASPGVYVQNVGDSSVNLVAGQCLYINGVLQSSSANSPTLQPGATTLISNALSGASGDKLTIKVVTEDGTFSQVIQAVP